MRCDCRGGLESSARRNLRSSIMIYLLAPTRIEQRIGRVDRIEARGRLRNVVLSSNCLYEGQWLSCLDKVIGVFHRSVAPLQYVLLEATKQFEIDFLTKVASRSKQENATSRTRLMDSTLNFVGSVRKRPLTHSILISHQIKVSLKPLSRQMCKPKKPATRHSTVGSSNG